MAKIINCYNYNIRRSNFLDLPNSFLYGPAVVKLQQSNDEQSDGSIVEKHGRHESQSLTRLGYRVHPQVGELADIIKTVSSHFSAEQLVGVPDTTLKATIIESCYDALAEESNATGVKCDPSRTTIGIVQLSSTAACTTQNLSTIFTLTSI